MKTENAQIGVVIRRYKGETALSELVVVLADPAGREVVGCDGGSVQLQYRIESDGGGCVVDLNWRVIEGRLAQTALGMRMEEDRWSEEGYAWMAGAVYAGNRFTVRQQPYSPRYPEADARADTETVITDIPRLEKLTGKSRVQLLTGDLSAPAMGAIAEGGAGGFHLCSEFIDTTDLWEIEETAARDCARFTVLRGGVREGRYSFAALRTGEPSGDIAPDLETGVTIHQRFRIQRITTGGIAELFKLHFDWMMAAKLPRESLAAVDISFKNAADIVEEKYHRENWHEANELFATNCAPGSVHYYQVGWCGGGITDYALLAGKHPLSSQRAERGLNHLCRCGQLQSGFFLGKCTRDGEWTPDFTYDSSRPYTHTWHLVRRQADILLYLLKAVRLQPAGVAADSLALWRESARRLADALCQLWETHLQLGQFIDARTGVVLVGGSTSGGAVPAGLVLAHREFGHSRYLRAACKSAELFYNQFTAKGFSTGGPGDACQAPDSESCAALLESYVTLHELSHDPFWLQAATEQAAQLASWIMPYDFPFPASSEFGRLGIPSTGSVFANAQNKHSAPGICTHSGGVLRRLAALTGDRRYETLLQWILAVLAATVSRADRPIHDPSGKPMPPGYINERVNTSDWDDNLGGIFFGSCWCEVSLLLAAAEIA